MTAGEDRVAVRWRARGTFAGPGRFQGFVANGARLEMEGCDVLTVNADGQDRAPRRLPRQRRRRPPARAAAAGGLARRGPPDPARQRAHPRAARGSRDRTPSGSPTGVWLVRGGIPQDHERVPDRGRGRRHRVRLRRVRHGRAGGRRRGAPRRDQAGRARPRRRRPPRRGAGLERAGLLPPRRARRRRVVRLLPGLLGPREARSARPYRPLAAAPDLGRRRRSQIAGTLDRGRRGRRLQGRPPPRPRSRADRAVPRIRSARARLRHAVHARSPERAPAAGARPASGLQPGHRAGARVDPQARGARPARRCGPATPTP